MSLQKGSSRSSRRRSSRDQWFSAKKKDVVRDEGVSNEAPKTAGKIGYGASVESSGSSSLLTSLLDQVVENNITEAAGNNDKVGNTDLLEGIMNKEYTAAMGPSDGWVHLQSNLLDDTNINSSTHMDLTVPSDGWGEANSFWMSQLEGAEEQQNFGPEDLVQVDDAWNDALGLANQSSLSNAPLYDPAVQFAQDDGLWSWSPGMLF